MQRKMTCEHGRSCQSRMGLSFPTSVENKKGSLTVRKSDLLISYSEAGKASYKGKRQAIIEANKGNMSLSQ